MKTVGLLYSNSDPLRHPIADAKAYLESKGVSPMWKKTGNTTTRSCPLPMLWWGQVDAVFTPLTTWSWAPPALWPRSERAGIPPTGADSFVKARAALPPAA